MLKVNIIVDEFDLSACISLTFQKDLEHELA